MRSLRSKFRRRVGRGRPGLRVAFCITAAVMPACNPHSPEANPAPPNTVPERFASDPSTADLPERWWQEFDDPQLHELVETAFRDSPRLKTSWARFQQAEALARQATAGWWPKLDADGRAGTQSSLTPGFDPATGGVAFTPVRREIYDISFQASYELDIWGKVSAGAKAALLEHDATRDDFESAAMSLTADVTETWFNVVLRRAEMALLDEQLETNETFMELVMLRFQQGLASALDVHQQRQQIASTRAQLARAGGQHAAAAHRLAVLLGRPPRQQVGGARSELPKLPPLPNTGIPSQLLTRRPDIRAAQRRVVSADHRVAVAVANHFPALRLTGSVGWQATTPGALFDELIWSVIGGITAPLFQGGRLSAEVDRNRAVVKERTHQYGQVVLQAFLEVENALVLEKHQHQQLEELAAQLEHARGSVRESRSRYLQGLNDFLPVLTALQSKQRTEMNILAAQRQLLSYRVQLYQALGGTWTAALVAPGADEEGAQ